MKWSNLKQSKCPQCNKDLLSGYDESTKMFKCSCGFNISTKRMTEIVSSKVGKDIAFRCPPSESSLMDDETYWQ